MAHCTQARKLGAVFALFAGALVAHDSMADAGYAITSLNTPLANFVTTGDSVKINVTAPSTALALSAVVKLNGMIVNFAFLPDAAPGSKTGTVPGLQIGDNAFRVYTSKTSQSPVAQLTVTRATTPTVACSSLMNDSGLPVANTHITSATLVAATQTVPQHCNVVGTINAGRVGYESSPGAPVSRYTYAINWQARLPTAWNGRFYMPGGGGTDGSVPGTTANLNQGYAAAANDSGHSNAVNTDNAAGGSAAFGTDYLARVDFAYNAIDVTTQTAKALLNRYYGKAPTYSYFEGCSMGGREAMMVTQRLPTYFNGVVSGDPAFRITKVGVWASYEGHQLGALATSMGLISANNVPFANNTYSTQDLQLVSKAILTACDSLDGLVDGMVNHSQACTTAVVSPVLDALQCASKTPACLTGGQITAIKNIYDKGAPNSLGVPQYAPWMWDAGIAGCTSPADCNTPTATNINGGWRTWNIGAFSPTFVPNVSFTANGAFNFASLGGGAIPTLFQTPPVRIATAGDGLAKYTMTTDFDVLAQSIFGTSAEFPVSDTALLNVDATDLSPFRNNGGKLVVYVGQSGGPFSPQDLVNWYTDMNTAMGGTAQSFARLFLVPGMGHCSGGPATSTFSSFASLVKWVESGVAPDSIAATAPAATPWPGRTRPLCPYPTYAHYNGSGDINLASNFSCQP